MKLEKLNMELNRIDKYSSEATEMKDLSLFSQFGKGRSYPVCLQNK